VAFFVAAASGHRLAARTVLAVGYASSVWLARSPGTGRPLRLARALLVAAWSAVMVIAAEAARLRRERTRYGRQTPPGHRRGQI
jgi:hypothetical protein